MEDNDPALTPDAPETTAAAEATTPTPAPVDDRYPQLETQLAQQAATIGQLQGTIAQLLNATAEAAGELAGDNEPAVDPSAAVEAKLKAFWANPDEYLREHAIKPATEAIKQQMVPYLRTQANDRRNEHVNEVRTLFDSRYGEGEFDREIAPEFNKAIDRLPLEMQSSREHIMAAASGVLGHHYLRGEKADNLETKRAARKASPRMLDQSRPRPRGDVLTPEEKSFVASLQRQDPEYTEDRYLKAKARVGGRKAN